MSDASTRIAQLFQAGRFLDAAQVLSQSAGDHPDHRSLHNQAAAMYKAGRFTQAVDLARGAIRLESRAARTHYLLGLALRDAGRLSEALDAFDHACSLDPGSPRAFYARGISHFLLGHPEPAVNDIQTSLRLGRPDPVALFNLAVCLVALSRWQEAVETFIRSFQLDPAASRDSLHFLVEIGRAQVYEEVYGQGHRLKNMLGVLGDRLERLAAEISSRLSPGEHTELDEIRDKHSLLFSDLNAFLSSAGQSQLELDLVDLRDLLSDVLVACSSQLASVKVVRRYPQTLPEIVCDPNCIREALLNLVLNAAEALAGVTRPTLTLTIETLDDRVQLDVADSGPGVTPDRQKKIFRFGFSTKPFGSGLGLSQARRTAERHGGSLVLVPHDPPGATFRLTLPISPRIDPGIDDLSLKPVLSEDLRELLADVPDDTGTLLL